jgi:two-component system OmpR family response regulator
MVTQFVDVPAHGVERERAPVADRPVLIVEDDPHIRTLLGDILTDVGYPVVLAPDGAAALHYLFAHVRPGCVLLDLRLPVVSGVTFRQALQRDPELAMVPVIVVSGEHPDARMRAQLQAAAYVDKPFTVDEVVALVHRHHC